MNKTYKVNMADQHLTVKSLEVLDGLSGKTVRALKTQLDALQETNSFSAAPIDYWSQLSDDGLITPVEKKTIKSEVNNIEKVYAALLLQAQEQEKTGESRWQSYVDNYYALINYLNTVVRLFDDMNSSTVIADRDTFNNYFSNYYEHQSDAQILLTQGEPGRIRQLSSLYEAGTAGEVAVYNNWFYIYTTKWEAVSKDQYLGDFEHAPKDPKKDQYFLAKGEAILKKFYIAATDKIISVSGKLLVAVEKGEAGNIYVWDGDNWQIDEDHNSYRYLVATNDLVTNNYPISEGLSAAISQNSGSQKYLGMKTVDPDITTIEFESYYTYIGATTQTRKKGYLYIYKRTGWQEINPSDPKSYSYYMNTLQDTLVTTDPAVGAFAGLFAGYIAANNAFIQKLQTQVITLMQGGQIKSEEYDQGIEGVRIKSDGDIQSANYNETLKTGYKLGKDGIIHSNSMIAEQMQAEGGTIDDMEIITSCKISNEAGFFTENYETNKAKGLKIYEEANGDGICDATKMKCSELSSNQLNSYGYSYINLAARVVNVSGYFSYNILKYLTYTRSDNQPQIIFNQLLEIVKCVGTGKSFLARGTLQGYTKGKLSIVGVELLSYSSNTISFQIIVDDQSGLFSSYTFKSTSSSLTLTSSSETIIHIHCIVG